MEIVVIGSTLQLQEIQRKFGAAHHYTLLGKEQNKIESGSVVFDFLIRPGLINEQYKKDNSLVVFADSSFTSLSQLMLQGISSTVFGFCGLNTFINREVLEVSCSNNHSKKTLEDTCTSLGTKCLIVSDSVGMISPRVVCMIINEAYYTVEEGTATREDIDKAMKLGTNYPFGPFEWCERIGKQNVCDLLNAVYNETKDQRYKVCDLLLQDS